jgi:tetratricopeptide (TPR) repeat protein
MERTALLVAVLLALPAPVAGQTQPTADPLARAQEAVDAGRTDEALALVAPILKRDPRNARALLVRSTAHCLDGDLEHCRADLDKVIQLDPSLRQAWLNRSALAISDKRYDDALAALDRAEKLDPKNPDNGLNQGAVLLLAGRLEPATAQFQRYLDASQGSAEAWYLVATNYAFSGYSALAIRHLEHAIQLDDRERARARTDPNFSELASNSDFQKLMSTDSFVPAPGSSAAEKTFQTRYDGADSPILTAALNTIQLGGAPLDRLIEVNQDWALLRSDFRVKLLGNADGTTTVRLTAPPGKFTDDQWRQRTDAFFAALQHELLKLELAAGRQPKQPPSD